ncbi:hypothetical protein D1AOALGA4SA_6094 [Olavius algarvensis Delta 1 endosymbiont]|nr:hypothetical protein D1AOALGA4SA_6094 [Olavius algarvensis Delta 1 endosymbiont]
MATASLLPSISFYSLIRLAVFLARGRALMKLQFKCWS